MDLELLDPDWFVLTMRSSGGDFGFVRQPRQQDAALLERLRRIADRPRRMPFNEYWVLATLQVGWSALYHSRWLESGLRGQVHRVVGCVIPSALLHDLGARSRQLLEAIAQSPLQQDERATPLPLELVGDRLKFSEQRLSRVRQCYLNSRTAAPGSARVFGGAGPSAIEQAQTLLDHCWFNHEMPADRAATAEGAELGSDIVIYSDGEPMATTETMPFALRLCTTRALLGALGTDLHAMLALPDDRAAAHIGARLLVSDEALFTHVLEMLRSESDTQVKAAIQGALFKAASALTAEQREAALVRLFAIERDGVLGAHVVAGILLNHGFIGMLPLPQLAQFAPRFAYYFSGVATQAHYLRDARFVKALAQAAFANDDRARQASAGMTVEALSRLALAVLCNGPQDLRQQALSTLHRLMHSGGGTSGIRSALKHAQNDLGIDADQLQAGIRDACIDAKSRRFRSDVPGHVAHRVLAGLHATFGFRAASGLLEPTDPGVHYATKLYVATRKQYGDASAAIAYLRAFAFPLLQYGKTRE